MFRCSYFFSNGSPSLRFTDRCPEPHVARVTGHGAKRLSHTPGKWHWRISDQVSSTWEETFGTFGTSGLGRCAGVTPCCRSSISSFWRLSFWLNKNLKLFERAARRVVARIPVSGLSRPKAASVQGLFLTFQS